MKKGTHVKAKITLNGGGKYFTAGRSIPAGTTGIVLEQVTGKTFSIKGTTWEDADGKTHSTQDRTWKSEAGKDGAIYKISWLTGHGWRNFNAPRKHFEEIPVEIFNPHGGRTTIESS